jgi:hypothetical protein
MNKTIAIRITGAVATAALTVVALAGCGSSAPTAPTPDQVSAARTVCTQLAAATAIAGATADEQNLHPLEAVNVDDGQLAPAFGRDAQNVVDNFVWPSTDQIAKLQADCTALGVTDPIWPSWYHL